MLVGFRTGLAVLFTMCGMLQADEFLLVPVKQAPSTAPGKSHPVQANEATFAKIKIKPVSQQQLKPAPPPAPPVLSHPAENHIPQNQQTFVYPPAPTTPVFVNAGYPSYHHGSCEECDNGKCYGWVNGCQRCEDEAWSSKYCKRRWPGMNFFDKWFRQPWIKSHCIQPADCCESAKWYKYP